MARKSAAAVSAVDLQDALVEQLKGVGLQAGEILRSRGIATVGELLSRPPRRYMDLRNADDWGLVRAGEIGALVALEALVVDARPIGNPRSGGFALALREPGTIQGAVLRAVFFNAPPGVRQRAAVGSRVRVIGTIRSAAQGPELVHPKLLAPDAHSEPIEPVYAGVGALAPGNIARIMASAVKHADEWADPVPPAVAAKLGLISSGAALRAIHKPAASTTPEQLMALRHGQAPAHRRLGFEELLALNVALERMRRAGGNARAFPVVPDAGDVVAQRLGFALTAGQRDAVAALGADLARERPMRRLLAGDVGSGKTAVAAAATLAVLRNGGSVAWLAPTTLVAEQHGRTLARALGKDAGPLAILLGSTVKRAKDDARRAMEAGFVRLVVGTHTLLEDGSTPPGLGLAVIDEQHRFGVAQRLALVSGRTPVPHLLVLSATPIPRTLALARYGDLDLVTIPERPAGRQPVTTRVVEPGDRAYVIHTIERALAANENTGRAFVVVPRIDAEDASEVALGEADAWLASHFGRDRVAIVSGRMPPREQHEAVSAFRQGSHPVLLGTSVVEVGLDVPEANLMVVLGADHFGIAQLHQLRGRVGRGGQKAACLLVPEKADPEARARLDEVAACDDGFELAARDLARRGAGEWFGARQSGGDTTVHFADPLRDADLLAAAAHEARVILDADPKLERHGALARAVARLLRRGAAPAAEEAG